MLFCLIFFYFQLFISIFILTCFFSYHIFPFLYFLKIFFREFETDTIPSPTTGASADAPDAPSDTPMNIGRMDGRTPNNGRTNLTSYRDAFAASSKDFRISKCIDRINIGIGRIIERIKRIIGVLSYPKNTRENTQYAY